MSYSQTLAGSFNLNFSWKEAAIDTATLNGVTNNNTIVDAGNFSYSSNVNSVANTLYHMTDIVNSGAVSGYNLYSLNRPILGGSETIVFNYLYGIYVENTSTSGDLTIKNKILGSGAITIAAGNALAVTNVNNGWFIDVPSQYIYISGVQQANFRMGLIGKVGI